MEYLLSKFRKREPPKEVTLKDLQTVLVRTQSAPKNLKLSTGDYNEVYPKIYVGDW